MNIESDNLRTGHTAPTVKAADAGTVRAAQETLEGRGGSWLKRLLPFMGPAFIASVAYVTRAISRQTFKAARNSATCCSGS